MMVMNNIHKLILGVDPPITRQEKGVISYATQTTALAPVSTKRGQ